MIGMMTFSTSDVTTVSILVDEARTPLIISGPSEESVDKYHRINRIIPRLKRGEEIEDPDGTKYTTGDFLVDEKAHTASLTEQGMARAERLLGVENLWDPSQTEILHAVKPPAHLAERPYLQPTYDDPEYVVRNVWRLYGGWYDGVPSHLRPAREVEIGREVARLAGGQGSHQLSALALADGLAIIEEGPAQVPAGTQVEVIRLDVEVA